MQGIDEAKVIEYVNNHMNENEPGYEPFTNNCIKNAIAALDAGSKSKFGDTVTKGRSSVRMFINDVNSSHGTKRVVVHRADPS